MGKPREVFFYSDGLKLAGLLYEPEGTLPGQRRPTVVCCHGYTGMKDVYLLPVPERLAAHGYVALAFDHRGFGKSEGARARLIPWEQAEDIRNAITFAGTLSSVDPDRLGLYGTSFGGANVVMVAGTDERARCTVCVVGIGDGERWLKSLRGHWEWLRFLDRLAEDRVRRVLTGKSDRVDITELMPGDPHSRKVIQEKVKAAQRAGWPGSGRRVALPLRQSGRPEKAGDPPRGRSLRRLSVHEPRGFRDGDARNHRLVRRAPEGLTRRRGEREASRFCCERPNCRTAERSNAFGGQPMPVTYDLSGQVALTQGTVGALGSAMVRGLARAGAHVVAADVDEPGAEKLAAESRAAGVRALALRADVTDATQVQALVGRTVAEFGRIDILLNCAGNIRRKATLDMTPEEWDNVMDVNLRSAWLCCRATVPVMVRQRKGCIVNMSSNAGLHGYGHGYSAYGPAKAGIHLLTKNLAIEWGRHGIRVNALVPGFTNTAFNADILANPDFAKALLDRIPLGGYLPPEGMVGPFLFLCSEAAAYVTGHMLHVDLGLNAR